MVKILQYVIISLVIAGFTQAQESVDSTKFKFQPNKDPVLKIVKVKNGSIKIDGVLDEEAWKLSETAGNFTEINPGDNVKPEVETETKILYDDDNIYFAFINYDNDMTKLRATMTDRDNIWQDDYAGPILDTYGDTKQAYELFVNPYGIQGDLSSEANGNEDSNFDMIWYAESKIYKDRWIAEFSIPFKSVRFSNKTEQIWKVHLWRTRPRNSRQQITWAPVSRDIPSFLGQMGTLTGVRNVKKSSNLEILPYVLGSQSGSLSDLTNQNSEFKNEKVKGQFGIGVKYGFTSNLTGELTYNPDFSQVESDAQQINVNSANALFYPEKRPFFLEGKSIFNTYFSMVYTRSINNPIYAGKLTGKIKQVDVGFISAYDENTPYIIPFSEKSVFLETDLKSLSNILRVKKNFKGESFIGLLATDRETKGSSYSRALSLDGSYNFNNNYYINWQIIGHSIKEPNDTSLYNSNETFGKRKYTAAFDGEKFNSVSSFLEFQRNSRYWSFSLNYTDVPPEARLDNGFNENNDFRRLFMNQRYTYFVTNKIMERISGSFNTGIRYDYNGIMKERWLQPVLSVQFKKQTYAEMGGMLINDEKYGGVFHKGVHRGFIFAQTNASKFINGSIFYQIGKFIVRFASPSYVGFGFNAELGVNIKPFDRLTLENNWSYSELSKSYGGEKLYTGYILRNKAIFQFNKNIFLRVITQFNSFSKELEIDPLFSYKWNPFTIFYIGSTHLLADFSDIRNGRKLVETSRQFFAKFQYLWSI